MARRVAEGCMICDPDPCQCFAKPVKAKAAPRPKKRPVEEPAGSRAPVVEVASVASTAPRPDLKARMKAAAAAAPPKPLPVLDKPAPRRSSKSATELFPKKSRVVTTKTEEEILLHAAIRNLKDVLHEDELTQWGMVATSSPSAAERAVEWKARRAWQLQSTTSA